MIDYTFKYDNKQYSYLNKWIIFGYTSAMFVVEIISHQIERHQKHTVLRSASDDYFIT